MENLGKVITEQIIFYRFAVIERTEDKKGLNRKNGKMCGKLDESPNYIQM